jgi:multicomponent Na+:H+ antiporter subunit B
MVLFSVIVLLRGHNDPGGGFIAGLIAASATAILGLSGVGVVRRMLRVNPIVIAGSGLMLAILSGGLSVFAAVPFLTGLWLPGHLFGTPGLFDIGVYVTVFGTVSAIILALEDAGEGN